MSLYIRWGGIALIMIAALLVSREYEKYLDKRVCEYRGLVAMISHAESEIAKSLAYGEGLWRTFHDDALEKCGLLPLLREGEGISSAFGKIKEKTSLTSEAKEKISVLFAGLGKGYAESELKTINDIKESLTVRLKYEEESAEKNLKIARALLLGGALTAAIMGV